MAAGRLAVIALLVSLSCSSPNLDTCASKPVGDMTPREIAACYELAVTWADQPTEELQAVARDLQSRIPVPTPTPTPRPPTTTVGFLEFSHDSTVWRSAPGEETWFNVYNSSGRTRSVSPSLWSARDSGGTQYGPYLISFTNVMVTSDRQGRGCWDAVGRSTTDRRLRAGVHGCQVGFVWFHEAPDVRITQVRYDDQRLPYTPLDREDRVGHSFFPNAPPPAPIPRDR